jgi:AcrR family transcriptional regulator
MTANTVKSGRSAARIRAGRPTQAQSAQLAERLRQAAVNVFLKSGFEGTSMEAIARAAGITKRTLYARYADKQALFADTITWALDRYHWHEPALETGTHDLQAGLIAIARSALARAQDPDIVRLSRMAIAEAERIPAFATQAYCTTWSPRIQAVISLLDAHVQAGTAVVDDLEIAAEQFLAMVGALPTWLAVFGQCRTPEMEERYIQHAVALFLRSVQPR